MPRDTAKMVQKVDNKGTDKKKKAPEKKKKKGNFFKETIQGFKRVSWPTRKELISATAAVIVFVLAVAVLVAGLDEVFRRAMFQPLTGVTRLTLKEKEQQKEDIQKQQEELQQQIDEQLNALASSGDASSSSIQPEIVFADGSTGSDGTGVIDNNITFSSDSDAATSSEDASSSSAQATVPSAEAASTSTSEASASAETTTDQPEAASQEPAASTSTTTE